MPSFELFTDKDIAPAELANLLASVGWGEASTYDEAVIDQFLDAYPVVVHCRDAAGLLIGYVSAFMDETRSMFVGELAVRPAHQRRGIGSALLAHLVNTCRDMPIHVTSFRDTETFFLDRGCRLSKRTMSPVSRFGAT
jgi:GNAT superfamily N-acetyltransferase